MRGRDRLNRFLLLAGFQVVPRLPRVGRRLIAQAGARLAVRSNPDYVDTYRDNLQIALSRPVSKDLLRMGVKSYLRTWTEIMTIHRASPQELIEMVVVDPEGEQRLRDAAAGPGAVVALPHIGNWDLAGAWACSTGLPVSTVAEQLGEVEYATFTAMRERLGMRVYAHTDRDAVTKLVAEAKAGRLVCLLSDRDLTGSGIEVSWPTPRGSVPVRMPAGPAMIARLSGATLLAAACNYEGERMRITFSEPIETRPGRAGLVWMTQQVADFFAARVLRYPQDWHLMQPFFPLYEGDRAHPAKAVTSGKTPQ